MGATKTTTTILGNTIVEEFGIGDELYFSYSPGYDYVDGDIEVIIEYQTMGEEVGKEVQWCCEYLMHENGDRTDETTGILLSGDLPLPAEQYVSNPYTFTMPGVEVKEEIHFKLLRIAIDDGVEPTAKPAIVHAHISYTARIALD